MRSTIRARSISRREVVQAAWSGVAGSGVLAIGRATLGAMSGHRPWSEIRRIRDPKDPDVKAYRDAIDVALAIEEARSRRGAAPNGGARTVPVPQASPNERSQCLFLESLRGYVEALGG